MILKLRANEELERAIFQMFIGQYDIGNDELIGVRYCRITNSHRFIIY